MADSHVAAIWAGELAPDVAKRFKRLRGILNAPSQEPALEVHESGPSAATKPGSAQGRGGDN